MSAQIRGAIALYAMPCPGPVLHGPPRSEQRRKQVGTNCWTDPW